MWIVGLDETHGVCDPGPTDLADWWVQVQSHFDGLAPGLTDLLVRTDDGALHVLLFDSSPSPFVIKNPVHGREGGGPVEREVPWREGTRVRSATREDLVRLLVPLQTLPDVEVLSASVQAHRERPANPGDCQELAGIRAGEHVSWRVDLQLYVTPAADTPVVLPTHRTKIAFRPPSETEFIETTRIEYSLPGWYGARGFRADSVSIETTSSEAIIRLPGRLYVSSCHEELPHELPQEQRAYLRYSVRPSGTEHSVLRDVELLEVHKSGKYERKWAMPGTEGDV